MRENKLLDKLKAEALKGKEQLGESKKDKKGRAVRA